MLTNGINLNLIIYGMKMTALFILLLTITLITSVCLFTILHKKKKMSHYLNVNSTLATENGQLNASDLGYSEMLEQRKHKLAVFEKIKKFVDAPPNSKVILTSGSTEGIATCINWAARYNPYGSVIGTENDHDAVEANAKARGLKYKRINRKEPIDGNCSCLFLTHVNSKTGEILDSSIIRYAKSITAVQRLNSDFEIESEKDKLTTTSYPPLVFADVTQSIGKIPISMKDLSANGLMFSLHKLGGPQGLGILVISEPKFSKFVPLIAGTQNDGLRGGTQNEQALIESEHVFKLTEFPPSSRKAKWEAVKAKFDEHKVKLIEPKGDHLYNTFLIEIPVACPMGLINVLAENGIYIGTASACANETDAPSTFVRISFIDPDDLDDKTVSKIISEIKKLGK